MQHKLTPGRLLDARGHLAEAGYATSLIKAYDRGDIRASALRIKEWDYYLIHNGRYGLALTLDDNGYMSMLSASILDFEKRAERTVSPIGFLPLGKSNLPPSSAAGKSEVRIGKSCFTVMVEGGKRHFVCHLEKFREGESLDAELTLSDEPRDSMVIATPFPEKPTAFYYNQKIIGMRAEGVVRIGGETIAFDPADSFGLLDWGRGVWTYENTWYWGAGQGMVDGRLVGFNIGYGFGDVSAASENMLFVDGTAHKLDRLTFNIPKTAAGKDDFLSPWTFTSNDGRFEMDFRPILDRHADTNLGVLRSDQHQVFGYFSGTMQLDDGSKITLRNFLGFAEKVHNKW